MVCFTTPIISVVPSSVRKAVVNSWGNLADSVWKSIFPSATWPLLVARKASNDGHSTGRASAVESRQSPKAGDETRGCVCRPNAAGIDVGITGTTGLAIVDAILAGQRDAAELAKLRVPHIKAHPETIRKSLVGNWRSEHLFTLKQSRELYRTYQQLVVDCDLEIEKMLLLFAQRVDPAETPLPPDRRRNRAGKKGEGRTAIPIPSSICVQKPTNSLAWM